MASVGEQPEPGEEKIIRSHRDIIIRSQRDIFTFAAGSRNNGHERQCGIWDVGGNKYNRWSNLH